jgi:hypothetical protein
MKAAPGPTKAQVTVSREDIGMRVGTPYWQR